MARFDLTAEARSDLESIADYTTERWGKTQTERYLDAIEARLDQLARQPQLGRARPELREGLLSFPIQNHVVYYLRRSFGIVVVRLLHQRQDPHRHIG